MATMSAQRVGVYQPRSRRARIAGAIGAVRARFHALLEPALWRVLGCVLLVAGAAMLVAIAGYDATDPSFDVATGKAPANWLGQTGAYTADLLLRFFGLASLGLSAAAAAFGWEMILRGARPRRLIVRLSVLGSGLLLCSAGLAAMPSFGAFPAGAGGVAGGLLWPLIGKAGNAPSSRWIVLVASGVVVAGFILILWAVGWAMRAGQLVAASFVMLGRGMVKLLRRRTGARVARAPLPEIDDEEDEFAAFEDHEESDEPPFRDRDSETLVRRGDDRKRKPRVKELQPALNLAEGEYQLPPLGVLAEPPADSGGPLVSDDSLKENAKLLESVLSDFGVRGRISEVRPGPVVTLYEFEPAAGVKTSRVISLADDIARSMSALAARVAVIPGRNVIGIELPNQRREKVFLRELLAAPEYEKSRAPLTLALGKTIGGEPVMADLAKMPHLLIAGTTGSGKSVALNTMILSLLYRMPPGDCRMIMIDPKMLELSVYEGIPHLLAPVVIDPKKAVVALKWAVREMENRYGKMAKIGVRGVEAFNERVSRAAEKGEVLKRTVQTGFDQETGKPVYEDEILDLEPMPFIVVVVDEMADLMMISGKEIEGAVQRLAQMARAAGIHLIAATQRPSVDVITGTIKANFPTRISFQVTSKIDSRTILGEQGAEQLLGQGDMLYMMAGGRIRRVHGPFCSDSEVEDVVRFLKTQGRPDYLDAVTEEPDEDGDDDFGLGESSEGGDDLFDKAVQIVARERKVSTSYIQRRLQIGYNRAARLIERMEDEGMISRPNHQGKREILLPDHG
ncbi:MAG: DNA translocase FtsK 4TM domain-containing protein [Alphaproteobacteria bacterium]|nr:DNA translocase FtsK 4TM domain-containing protein [Alphaproteobacteria bacterium]